MRRLPVVLSVAIMTGLLASSLFAQEMMERPNRDEDVVFRMMGGSGRMGMRPGRMMRGMGVALQLADELKLSKEQRDEITGILTNHRKEAIRRNADREIARIELQRLVQQEEPDMEGIEAQIRKIANLDAEIKYSRIKAMMDARNVLTKEQKEALKKIQQERRAVRKPLRRGDDRPGPMRGRARRRGR